MKEKKNYTQFAAIVLLAGSAIQAMEHERIPLLTVKPTVQGKGIMLALPAAHSVELCDTNTYALIQNELLTNPGALLQKMIQVQTPLELDKTCDCNTSFLLDLSKSNPICLLTECFGGLCAFDRLKNPRLRGETENEIVELVKNNYPDKQKKLVYLGFGSGGLYSDIIIATKLIEAGYKTLDMRLIDTKWESFIEAVKHSDQIESNFVDANERTQMYMRLRTFTFLQFIKFLMQAGGHITLSIYADSEKYLKDHSMDTSELADLLVGFDYRDPNDEYGLACRDAAKLALYATKQGAVIASLVDFGNFFKSMVTKTISLTSLQADALWQQARINVEWEKFHVPYQEVSLLLQKGELEHLTSEEQAIVGAYFVHNEAQRSKAKTHINQLFADAVVENEEK